MAVLTYDIETTYGTYMKRAGSPWGPDFRVCAIGWKVDDLSVESSYHVKEVNGENIGGFSVYDAGFFTELKEAQWLVGANVKFDNLWFWPEVRQELARGLKVWDVLYAHYLLTGQLYNLSRPEHMRPSLNAVAAYYDLPTKIEKVKKLWDDGVRTEDIDEDILLEYQEYDVELTEKIFRLQVAQLKQQGRFNQVFQRMEGLLATTEMEYNGLKIHMERARELQHALEVEWETLRVTLECELPDFPEELEFSWGSATHVSAIIFGGDIKYEKWVQHRWTEDEVSAIEELAATPRYGKTGNLLGYKWEKSIPTAGHLKWAQKTIRVPVLDDDGDYAYYKSGKQAGEQRFKNEVVPDYDKPKGAIQDFYFTCQRQIRPKAEWATKIAGRYSVASEVLEALQGSDIEFIDKFTRWKAIDKDLGTYYERNGKGMLTLVDENGFIHHSLNHTKTITSRLSSSNPNLQNIPSGKKSDIKGTFVSRYHGGLMAEIDYSQLEVVTKAVLSGDVALREDLLRGVCFHCKNLSFATGESYESIYHKVKVLEDPETCDARQAIKAFTFAEKYGAAAKSMAKSTGLTEDGIKALMKAKKEAYPEEAAFDEYVTAEVADNKIPTRLKSEPSHFPLSAGYYHSDTGTWYSFLEEEAPEWLQKRGTFTAVKPTILKNYPSQGLGGEIMQIQLGRTFRWLLRSDYDDDVKLVNTVHDCCWLDLRSREIAETVVPMVVSILEDVSDYWLQKFNVNWYDMPFPVAVEIGPNMLDLHKM